LPAGEHQATNVAVVAIAAAAAAAGSVDAQLQVNISAGRKVEGKSVKEMMKNVPHDKLI